MLRARSLVLRRLGRRRGRSTEALELGRMALAQSRHPRAVVGVSGSEFGGMLVLEVGWICFQRLAEVLAVAQVLAHLYGDDLASLPRRVHPGLKQPHLRHLYLHCAD